MSCLADQEESVSESTDPSRSARSATFDCSICLDFASEPVVTLCGHLYCWPCIYKWLASASPQQCPVCKAPVSVSALVPLYGRGGAGTGRECLGIPNRPNRPMSADYFDRRQQIQYCPSPSVSGTLAIAVHPLLSRNGSYLMRPYRLDTITTSPRERWREMRVEESLRQIWTFLLCFAVLCLLFF